VFRAEKNNLSKNRFLITVVNDETGSKAGWRKLHNEGLHNLYSSPNIIKTITYRMRWVGHVARMREDEKCKYNRRRKTFLEDVRFSRP
jgi:hypothetical protein